MGGGDDLTHPINENNSLRSEFSIHRIDTLTYDTMDFFGGVFQKVVRGVHFIVVGLFKSAWFSTREEYETISTGQDQSARLELPAQFAHPQRHGQPLYADQV